MRALALSVFLLAACGDDQPPPIDASVEHMTPSDLGNPCSGGMAGCFQEFNNLGGTCLERCVSIGNWTAICTGLCATDADCVVGGTQLHCVDYDTSRRVCMNHLATEDPNMGCANPADGGMPRDAPPFQDAPAHD
jgi:hypothetical protein